MRRTPRSGWGWRKRYDVELVSPNGVVKASQRATAGPSGFLTKRAGVHATDSWDWVKAADDAFEAGSREWVTWPYGDWRPTDPGSLPSREP
jgi:hypothetical protein